MRFGGYNNKDMNAFNFRALNWLYSQRNYINTYSGQVGVSATTVSSVILEEYRAQSFRGGLASGMLIDRGLDNSLIRGLSSQKIFTSYDLAP